MPSLPTGTVTFLFTDLEGSTALLQRLGDQMYAEILAEHQRLLREAFAEGHGQEIDTQGDAFLVAFPRARDALATAVAAQQSLMKHPWPDGGALRVRMGLHTGEPVSGGTGYVGMDVHRAARIAAAGHGGQILLSDTVSSLTARDLPPGVSLRDLGPHRLKDLQEPEHILQIVHPDLPSEFPRLKSLDALPNNLPRQLTSFIGREKEIAEVKRLLSTTCLLTLTGAGGAGKTRLALQVATDLLDDYPDGVWLAQLAPLSEPALVPKAVASAMGIPEQPGRPLTDTVVDYLRPKSPLLVLDNCEHLLEACANLADTLLQACSKLRIMATSRETLGIAGELTYRVPSLSLPDPKHLPPLETLTRYEAVRLFVERAAFSRPGFQITSGNAASVAQVTHRLDGIPLAIELAAARIKAVPVDVIAARLDDQFRLLTGGSRTGLPRHQTLRATLDWSYDLLSEQERIVLRRLSVFAGGFTVDAAEQVCAGEGVADSEILDLLTRLVDKSLVVFEEREEQARYSLLESVRQYGRDRLLETHDAAEVRGRHRDQFLRFAEDAEPRFWGAEEGEWLDRLEAEHDNLRAAIAWSAESGDAAAALRFIGAVGWFWYRHGHWAEGRNWAEKILNCTTDAPPLPRLKAFQTAGRCAAAQGDVEEAARLDGEALQLARQLGNKREIGRSLYMFGHVMIIKGDSERAEVVLDESLDSSREAGDHWTTASALRFWSTVALRKKDYARARDLATRSVALYRRVGYKRGIATAVRFLSQVSYHEQNYVEAGALLEESVALYQGIHDEEGRSFGLTILGNVARKTGEYAKALTFLTDALITQQKLGAKGRMAETLESFAAVCASQGHMPRAARLFGAAAALRETAGVGRVVGPPDYDELLEAVRVALREVAFADAWSAGEEMTLEQAIEYALAGEG